MKEVSIPQLRQRDDSVISDFLAGRNMQLAKRVAGVPKLGQCVVVQVHIFVEFYALQVAAPVQMPESGMKTERKI